MTQLRHSKPFDGDISKLATHRKTTPFATGGKCLRVPTKPPASPFELAGGEMVIPKATATKTVTVEFNVKDLMTTIIRKVVSEALLTYGAFPFMLEARPQRLVVIESPFGHPTKEGMEENAAYARRCMLDSLKRGEAPYASHLLYTQCLDDLNVDERKQGMEAGFAWGAVAQHVAIYTDRGISRGMIEGIKRHQANDRTIEFRSIK